MLCIILDKCNTLNYHLSPQFYKTELRTIQAIEHTVRMGHSIPNQQKKSLPSWIFMKFGTDMDSAKKLSHTKIWLILLISL